MSNSNIAVIGGGAAGFFAAIAARENYQGANVVIYEKSKNLLSKVKISGGGRCNLTNGCQSVKTLTTAYPRGGRALAKAFRIFNNTHATEWFESRGVPLMIQVDNRVFPASQNSQTIVDCLLRQAEKLNIRIEIEVGVKSIQPRNGKLAVGFTGTDLPSEIFDKVIVATGGSPRRDGLVWLEKLGHKIEDPVPSLFSFNMPGEPITKLMGTAVENALVSIPGTGLHSSGPLLITHWGMSGPAILELSAFGARLLNEKNYEFKVRINWTGIQDADVVTNTLNDLTVEHPRKLVTNFRPFALPARVWRYLLEKSAVEPGKKWGELGKRGVNKLVNQLTNDLVSASGKTTFREEFVTCGGVSLESIDMNTMQSRVVNNLYFAGEVMDIDGITGGFNFQAAWTTAYIAGKLK